MYHYNVTIVNNDDGNPTLFFNRIVFVQCNWSCIHQNFTCYSEVMRVGLFSKKRRFPWCFEQWQDILIRALYVQAYPTDNLLHIVTWWRIISNAPAIKEILLLANRHRKHFHFSSSPSSDLNSEGREWNQKCFKFDFPRLWQNGIDKWVRKESWGAERNSAECACSCRIITPLST